MSGWKGSAIVAFVDLLGFSQRLLDTWDQDDGAMQKLFQIRDEVGQMKAVGFGLYDPGYDDAPSLVASDEISLFSDSLIIVSRVPTHRGRPLLSPSVFSICMKVRGIIERAARAGFGVRGGVEYGELWWNGHEAIGPAFLTAYGLETRASAARVVIGPSLLRTYAEETGLLCYSKEVMYRCSDELYAVRPDADARDTLLALSAASPGFEHRYSETIDNAIEPLPGLVRASHLHRAANAAEALLSQKKCSG